MFLILDFIWRYATSLHTMEYICYLCQIVPCSADCRFHQHTREWHCTCLVHICFQWLCVRNLFIEKLWRFLRTIWSNRSPTFWLSESSSTFTVCVVKYFDLLQAEVATQILLSLGDFLQARGRKVALISFGLGPRQSVSYLYGYPSLTWL